MKALDATHIAIDSLSQLLIGYQTQIGKLEHERVKYKERGCKVELELIDMNLSFRRQQFIRIQEAHETLKAATEKQWLEFERLDDRFYENKYKHIETGEIVRAIQNLEENGQFVEEMLVSEGYDCKRNIPSYSISFKLDEWESWRLLPFHEYIILNDDGTTETVKETVFNALYKPHR